MFIFIFWVALTNSSIAADLVEVLPVTDRILRLTFDEGYVEKRGSDDAVTHRWPLDINAAARKIYYHVSSPDDPDYSPGQLPVKVGRKSKIKDISSSCNWNPTLQKCLNDYVSSHFIYLELPSPLQKRMTYTVEVPFLADNIRKWSFDYDPVQMRSPAVHVNQLGFAPSAKGKYAYVSQWMGDMGPLEIDSCKGMPFTLHAVGKDGSPADVVYKGTLEKQKDLQTGGPDTDKESAGPRKSFVNSDVWQCDFSDFQTPGEYILSVDRMGCSYPFRIHEDAYFEAFYYALRACYLQRAVTALPEAYAGVFARPEWQPDIVYTSVRTMDLTDESGKNQKQHIYDRINYHFDVTDTHGWYHDAGDWDGYFTHFRVPRTLMTVYELAPEKFQDDELNIPEAQLTNGYTDTHVPDLLDEAVWLVDYFKNNIGPTGGIFGSRVAPDISDPEGLSKESIEYHKKQGFNFQIGEKPLRSWKNQPTWIVFGEDPRDSYAFTGIAAQYACCLKLAQAYTGEDYTAIINEYRDAALDAYEWAGDNLHPGDLEHKGSTHNWGSMKSTRALAAVWLYKLTGGAEYHDPAEEWLSQYNADHSDIRADRWTVWAYVTIDEHDPLYSGTLNRSLKKQLGKAVSAFAREQVTSVIYEKNRSMRMGGSFSQPILNGQATTPWILPAAVAYKVSGESRFLQACYMTCDYFLGGNQLNMVWLTNVGHRYPKRIMHKDTELDGIPGNISGVPPYSPRSLCDWFSFKGSRCHYQGPWDNDFFLLDGRLYPDYADEQGETQWPLHELWFNQYTSPPGAEFTIHQNIAPAAGAFGFLCADRIKSVVNQEPIIEIDRKFEPVSEGDSVKINIKVSDPDGWIYQTELYMDNRLVSSVRGAPDSLWVRDLPGGRVNIRCEAADNKGLRKRSNTIILNVQR